jgi:hypothetical protein
MNKDEELNLQQEIYNLKNDGLQYFEKCIVLEKDGYRPRRDRYYYWNQLSVEQKQEGNGLIDRLLELTKPIFDLLNTSPLVTEADNRVVIIGIKHLQASLLFRSFYYRDTEVIHDEDTILGINQPWQSDDDYAEPSSAKNDFEEWIEKICEIIRLAKSSKTINRNIITSEPIEISRYKPGTAFIMMSFDKAKPELVDLYDTIKDVFLQFEISAIRADDIEHEGIITSRILDEIRTSEFLFAELTGERPNVYYEVGYAHALKRRVILFRKTGAGLHFDLAGYNCPEYENLRELREKLLKRLEYITNRKPKQK